jgi:glyoxylase-like metal-dependent hydrolase (beta-lactamase superfamily II)
VTWQRVSLGFVSAYILSRNGEAAVVDTGVAGSAGDIEAGLAAIGLGWDAVGHVILTHAHPDHIGSASVVLDLAADASGYAGAGDRDTITAPRELTVVGDGEQVFGLEIIATPGHTPGHICVLDPIGGLLVAGDALNGNAGGVVGPNPQFSADMSMANESVKKLAAFTFDTILFGHGEPVIGGADDQVAALAAGL